MSLGAFGDDWRDHAHHDKVYIGDAVYVSMQDGDVMLEIDRTEGRHWIVLEPPVYEALIAFVKAHRAKAGGGQ